MSERDRLILENLGLARYMARRTRRGRLTPEERFSAACFALVEAAAAYRPSRGKFSAYAGTAMRNQIERDAWEDHTIRIPRSTAYKLKAGARTARQARTLAAIDAILAAEWCSLDEVEL